MTVSDEVQVREVIRTLSALPATEDPRFPAAIRGVVEEISNPEDLLRSILDDTGVEHRIRFMALYGILLRLRREERHKEYADLVRKTESEFSAEPYFYTFQAIIARSHGADPATLRTAIELSRRAATLMPNVAGVLHQVAAFTVEYLELIEEPTRQLMTEAETYVDQAIAISLGKVGHYFETRARILALRGDFSAARTSVGEAISLEDGRARDYLRRVSQYQTTRVRIDMLAERSRAARAQEEFRSELNRFRTQQLELLGLLAAVVAFVVTAGNIAGDTTGRDGVRLMTVTSGAVILVFATFSLMSARSIWRVLVATVFGLFLVLLGLNAPNWLVK